MPRVNVREVRDGQGWARRPVACRDVAELCCLSRRLCPRLRDFQVLSQAAVPWKSSALYYAKPAPLPCFLPPFTASHRL